MRLLDRYLLRELLIPLGYCLGGFLIVFCAFDLISQLNHLQERHLRFWEIAEYYVVTIPALLNIIVPVSLLLALLYTLTDHARHNELTAMRAAGVSLWRISIPYFGVGLMACVMVFFINEFWVPPSADWANEILNRHESGGLNRNVLSKVKFLNEPEHRNWAIDKFNTLTGEMLKPNVSWEFADGSRRDIYASNAVYSNHVWVFKTVEEWDPQSPRDQPSKSKTYKELELPFSETPEWIKSDIKISNMKVEQAAKKPQLSIKEIFTYLRLHPNVNQKQHVMLLTQLQGRIADPFTSLAVVLIALPFGAPSGRRNVFVGVAASIFICFGYLILQRIFFGLGTGGYVPPFLAAWLPNAGFSIAGIVLISRVR